MKNKPKRNTTKKIKIRMPTAKKTIKFVSKKKAEEQTLRNRKYKKHEDSETT